MFEGIKAGVEKEWGDRTREEQTKTAEEEERRSKRLTCLRLDGLGAPLVWRQHLILQSPLFDALRLVDRDGARAKHFAADVAVHGGRGLHHAATAALVLLLLPTHTNEVC